jgi:hypothetical protein
MSVCHHVAVQTSRGQAVVLDSEPDVDAAPVSDMQSTWHR